MEVHRGSVASLYVDRDTVGKISTQQSGYPRRESVLPGEALCLCSNETTQGSRSPFRIRLNASSWCSSELCDTARRAIRTGPVPASLLA